MKVYSLWTGTMMAGSASQSFMIIVFADLLYLLYTQGDDGRISSGYVREDGEGDSV